MKIKVRTTLLLPDLHIGSQDKPALRATLKYLDYLTPNRVVILGDWLDVHSANSHGSSDRREAQAQSYTEELRDCRALLHLIEQAPGVEEIAYVEGNHEHRVERWAVGAGRFAREIVDAFLPEKALSENRQLPFTWVPYKREGSPSFLEVAPGLIACHGWSTAKNAALSHLRAAHGLSVVHGHTHRRQSYTERHPITGRPIEATSPGCLSKLHPLWVTSPTDWTHGVCVLQERGERWSLYTVPIIEGEIITPEGVSISAGAEDSVLSGVA